MTTSIIERTCENLTRRGFTPHHCSTGEEASRLALELLQSASTIGIGGSMTVKQLRLDEQLRACGKEVLWHWDVPGEERPALFQRVMAADAFLCSANALLTNGHIVNIDGTGNRLAATFFGPKTVIMICGSNKLVDGDLAEGIARIKREACPPNARRLKLETPCALTGHCTPSGECFSPQRMCRMTLELSACPRNHAFHVILTDEPLGY